MKAPLLPQDFIDDAARIGCEVEAIRAVAEVEAGPGGFGFCPDDFPKTLFEGHYFHKLTRGRYSESHPTISYPSWTRKFYGKSWQAERERLNLAITLDRNAALMSASWGTFQVMGANFATVGFKTVQQFVNAMCKSSNDHLAAFTEYVLMNGLADELRDRRFYDFARIYNGPGQVEKYGAMMQTAYQKIKARP